MTLWFCQRDGRTGRVARRDLDALPMFTVAAQGAGDALAGGYWLEDDGVPLRKTSGNLGRTVDLLSAPSPAVGGIDGHSHSQHVLVSGGRAPASEPGKPPYRVPSMAEINAVPWNGRAVVSTFAGCGGSSLGYRMAGFRVLWANEFVPTAQDSYRANMAAGTVLDCRDVKAVKPADILAAVGMGRGDLDVLDGSPPCQAFSTAGRRAKGWGQERAYEGGHSQRNEDLFQQYVRLLRGLMPRAFVAENVSGLVKGVAKGFFLEVLADLKASGYRARARLLDAQWLGVPQQRGRIIFVGVRDDLGVEPEFPAPLSYRYSVRDACPWIGMARSGPTGFGAGSLSEEAPAPTVSASMQAPYGAHEVTTKQERRKFTIAEVKRICAFPDDFVLTGSYAQQWERLGNSVPPVMMAHVAAAVARVLDRAAPARSSTATPRADGKARAAIPRKSKGAGASRAARSRLRRRGAPNGARSQSKKIS